MKKDKLPSLISILILTLITSIFWVSLTTYRAFTAKPSESVPEEISNPINPVLDQATMSKTETGLYFDSSQVPENIIVQSTPTSFTQPVQLPQPSPTIEATPTPIASPSP